MKDKKSVIVAVTVLVIIAAVGIGVGVHNFRNAPVPSEVQNAQTNDGADKNKENEKKNSENDNSGKEDKQTQGENKDESAENNDAGTSSGENEKTPVFMYFVSETDSDYEAALKVFEELKAEYKGKIEFELKNVTKEPELLENFSLVKGNTPALIMDGKEGITGFQFKMTDKKTLDSEIQKALK